MDGVPNLKAEHEGPDEVRSLLQGGRVLRVLARPHLHVTRLQVEPDLSSWSESSFPLPASPAA